MPPAAVPAQATPSHLRHAPAWLVLGVLRVCATALPLAALRVLGALWGLVIYVANAKRRRIARRNLALCFPGLDRRARRRMLRRHFRVAGQSQLDLAFLAWASERRFARAMEVVGAEHIERLIRAERRVILLAPHCVGMNVGGLVLAGQFAGVYSMVKPQRHPVVNWLLGKVRGRYGSPLIRREQGLRPVVKALRGGGLFYYLPDEDFGPQRSVFAPFFGVPTATLPTLGRLAALTGAAVVPCFTRLLPGGRGYEVRVMPPLADFPTGDAVTDATRMNAALEAGIREMPEQYLWTFKLFKTRPGGAPSPYA